MNVSLDNISRGMPPPFAAGASVASPAAKLAEGWKSRETGAAELARLAGEETVDEQELRRDDPLGNLVLRAFDAGIARRQLPELFG